MVGPRRIGLVFCVGLLFAWTVGAATVHGQYAPWEAAGPGGAEIPFSPVPSWGESPSWSAPSRARITGVRPVAEAAPAVFEPYDAAAEPAVAMQPYRGQFSGSVAAEFAESSLPEWPAGGPALQPMSSPPSFGAPVAAQGAWGASHDPWYWQVMPSGLLYKAYLANGRESRFASRWIYVRGQGWLWDAALGGRAGILRFGTDNPAWPEGWQIDIEGAAFPRLDLESHRDLVSSDFRFGVPLTHRRGAWEWKFGYYHLSSHLGDEYMLVNSRPRVNYVRDALVLGAAWHPWPDLRLYAETEYAFWVDGGAKPWAFQFGADYSPIRYTGLWGAPFFAVNGRLREENDFGGNVTVQTGWQWRGPTGHLMRVGLHYFNGLSDEGQFVHEHEDQLGVGLWYDF